MKKREKKLPRTDIPADFVYCFSHDCPRAADCLRFNMGTRVPDKPTIGLCVFPRAYEDGGCPYFRQTQTLRMAWGLTPLFRDILQKHSKELHARIYALLGSQSAYYRYNSGEYLLTPEQQEAILRIFESIGYDRAGLSFGGYVENFDFSPIK